MGRPQWSILEQLVVNAGASVVVPIYPLASEHDHRKAFAMVDACYDGLTPEIGS